MLLESCCLFCSNVRLRLQAAVSQVVASIKMCSESAVVRFYSEFMAWTLQACGAPSSKAEASGCKTLASSS